MNEVSRAHEHAFGARGLCAINTLTPRPDLYLILFFTYIFRAQYQARVCVCVCVVPDRGLQTYWKCSSLPPPPLYSVVPLHLHELMFDDKYNIMTRMNLI